LTSTAAALQPAAVQPDSVPETVRVPAGSFTEGFDRAEREAAYRLDEAAYGHGDTRRNRWCASERPRAVRPMPAFDITVTPITNGQYGALVRATGHAAPDVDRETWTS
jgi:formylglycine-generating enzyme required for sulfatase activity